jgi:hypothetical protein
MCVSWEGSVGNSGGIFGKAAGGDFLMEEEKTGADLFF